MLSIFYKFNIYHILVDICFLDLYSQEISIHSLLKLHSACCLYTYCNIMSVVLVQWYHYKKIELNTCTFTWSYTFSFYDIYDCSIGTLTSINNTNQRTDCIVVISVTSTMTAGVSCTFHSDLSFDGAGYQS